jgi:valyl-tRNA synthetase
LRFFLTTNSSPGLDLRFSHEKVEAAWNFINKLWNASRFVLINIPEDYTSKDLNQVHLSEIDAWIIHRYDESVTKITAAMENYEFALAGSLLYEFVWDDYCSWYIELSKANLNSTDEAVKQGTLNTLIYILKGILKLCHPTLPFVTEKIYSQFDEKALCISDWPKPTQIKDVQAYQSVAQVISLISELRSLKIEYQLKPSQPIRVQVNQKLDHTIEDILYKMVKAELVDHMEGDALVRPYLGGSFSLERSQLIDLEAEKSRLKKEIDRLEIEITRAEGMLKNERFIFKAPAKKVQAEKDKLLEYQRQYALVKEEFVKLQ